VTSSYMVRLALRGVAGRGAVREVREWRGARGGLWRQFSRVLGWLVLSPVLRSARCVLSGSGKMPQSTISHLPTDY
jgi:hypothetical protein